MEELTLAHFMQRLERYERATRLGLNPPAELGVLLRSAPARYKNSAFNGKALPRPLALMTAG